MDKICYVIIILFWRIQFLIFERKKSRRYWIVKARNIKLKINNEIAIMEKHVQKSLKYGWNVELLAEHPFQRI
jgi:hypothetical protein